jgi:hypothetical protein
MPKPTPAITSEPTSAGEVYRPVSALALAAFILAVAYAILVSVLGIVAYLAGRPLSLGFWILIFPVAALVLCAAARQQIRRSEDTLSGAGLATWAWWLSILFGLVFGAYYFATYLAIQMQARTFADQWLTRLSEAKTVEAFLDTLPPERRKFDKTADSETIMQRYGTQPPGPPGTKAPLFSFRDSDIVQFLEEAGPNAVRKFLGVRDWEWTGASYKVTLTYDLSAPTGNFEFQIPVLSSETKQVEGRQWAIVFADTKILAGSLSELGFLVEDWRKQARTFAVDWLKKLHQGELDDAFLDTLDPAKRSEFARIYRAQKAANEVLGLASMISVGPIANPGASLLQSTSLVDIELGRTLYLEGYDDFAAGKYIHYDRLDARANLRQDIIQKILNRSRMPWLLSMRVQGTRSRAHPIAADAQQLQFADEVELLVYPKTIEDSPPKYSVIGNLTVESDLGPINRDRKPQWRVTRLDLIRGGRPTAQKVPGEADSQSPKSPAAGPTAPRPPR